MKKIIIVMTMIIMTIPIYGGYKEGKEKVLRYEECEKMAEENNKEYKIAGKELEIAEAKLQEGLSGFGPTIDIQGGYEPIYKAADIEIPAGVLGPVEVRFPMGYQSYYSARVSLTQPIFTFGKIYYGYKMAEKGYEIAKIKYKEAREKLKLDVITGFYGALIAKKLYKIEEESYKRAEENLKIIREKYNNGEVSRFELLRAEVELANKKPEVRKARDRYEMAMDRLKNIIGIGRGKDIEIEGEIKYEKLKDTYEKIREKFERGSDDKEIMKKMREMSEYKSRLKMAMFLPTIALQGNLNYYTYEKDFHREKEYWESSWEVRLGLQWRIFDGFKNVAEYKEAEAEKEKQKLIEEETEDMLEIKLKKLYKEIEENEDVIEAAEKIIKQAEEGYRIAKESYINGLIKSIDLMDAELTLKKAKINYLNALLNYTKTLVELNNFIK